MGFKSLLLLITFVFVAIFSLQNLQSISLVFFSLNSLALPLSIWIILSLLAGIISSLVIQFLSNNFGIKNNYSQSFTPQTPTDYPPSPSVTESIPRQGKRQTLSSPPVFPSAVNNMPSEEDLNVFDDRQMKYTDKREPMNRNFFIEEKPLQETQKVNKIFENQNIDLKKETTSDTNVSFPVEGKLPVQDIPSPAWLKSREASLYSYQPREKTQIKKTPDKVDSNNKQSTNSSPSKNADGIYDASYRVIPPSQERTNQDDVYWDDEDEDWDF